MGSEELPPDEVVRGIAQLETAISESLTKASLAFESIECFGTPRRLVAKVTGLAQSQADVTETLRGPPKSRSFDDDGKPSKALEGKHISIFQYKAMHLGPSENISKL